MVSFDEDNYDEDKKMYAKEEKKSNFEKKILLLGLVNSVLVWYFYIRS
jgi:hypothetical protein